MEKAIVYITYVIYIMFWEALTLGGTAYLIAFHDVSGWWMILAVFLSAMAYSPSAWLTPRE